MSFLGVGLGWLSPADPLVRLDLTEDPHERSGAPLGVLATKLVPSGHAVVLAQKLMDPLPSEPPPPGQIFSAKERGGAVIGGHGLQVIHP